MCREYVTPWFRRLDSQFLGATGAWIDRQGVRRALLLGAALRGGLRPGDDGRGGPGPRWRSRGIIKNVALHSTVSFTRR